MNKLEELIQQYCPDGVEYKPLGDYLSYEQPTKYLVVNTKYDDSYLTPVLTAGQSFILGYTNEKEGIFQASKDVPVIIFDDFTTSFHWVDFSFKVKSSAMKMLRPIDEKKALFRYLFYCMKNILYVPGDHTRQWIGTYSQFEIPVPPLPVQKEIVRILDNFTELQAELQAELQKRIQQYNYYRDNLLSFDGRTDVEWKKLGDIASIKTGRRFVRTDIKESGVPCFHYGDLYTYYGLTATQTKGYLDEELAKKLRFAQPNDVVVVCAGENDMDLGVGVAWLGNEPAVVHDACCILHHNQNPRYISHFLRTHNYHLQMKKYVKNGKISSLPASGLAEAMIPIPSLEEQEKIASILDRFDTLTNDLTAGLPAEIEKRRQQYEYYRDKLLTFKRKAA